MSAAASDAFARFAEHATFLLFVLPIIGAVLVLASAPLGADVARRTALTNVLLSLGIALTMVVRFETPPSDGPFQMASTAKLEPGAAARKRNRRESVNPTSGASTPSNGRGQDRNAPPPLLRIAVGVDGLSLWLMLAIPAAMLPAILLAGRNAHPVGRLATLLLLQASLVGAFAALDAIFFIVCLESSSLLLFGVVGRWGGVANRRGVVHFAVEQIAGSLLVLFGLAAAVIAHQWMYAGSAGPDSELTWSLVRLAAELPPAATEESAASQFWSFWEPIVYTALVLGLLLKSGTFPFHGQFGLRAGSWPPIAAIAGFGVQPCLCVYGYLRLVAPICPVAACELGPSLAAVSIAGALYCALLALTQTDLPRTIGYAALAHSALALGCAASASPAGMTAAILLLIVHAAGFALLFFVADAAGIRTEPGSVGHAGRSPEIERQRSKDGDDPADRPVTSSARFPSRRSAALFVVASLAIVGFPGLSGFPALWLGIAGFSQTGRFAAAAAVVIVHLLLAAALLPRGLQRRRPEETEVAPLAGSSVTPKAENGSRAGRPFALADLAATTPALAVLIAFGLAPQFVVDRAAPPLKDVAASRDKVTRRGGERGTTIGGESVSPSLPRRVRR